MRFLLLFPLISALPLASQARESAELVRDYHGTHQDAFTLQFDRVRLLVRQAQIEASARLGLLQYQEGFQYPIRIGFEDGAPLGIENVLAFVRLGRTSRGFVQELVVNLDEMASNPVDFDLVFKHEMTHAVMNDAVGGDASLRIPHWVQEGLAQYVSGEGDQRVLSLARRVHRSHADLLLSDLDGLYTGKAYPQYYLAIKYMYDKQSSNAVQAFVRNLIAGKSVTDALNEATGMTYPQFLENVRQYSLNVFQDKALPDY